MSTKEIIVELDEQIAEPIESAEQFSSDPTLSELINPFIPAKIEFSAIMTADSEHTIVKTHEFDISCCSSYIDPNDESMVNVELDLRSLPRRVEDWLVRTDSEYDNVKDLVGKNKVFDVNDPESATAGLSMSYGYNSDTELSHSLANQSMTFELNMYDNYGDGTDGLFPIVHALFPVNMSQMAKDTSQLGDKFNDMIKSKQDQFASEAFEILRTEYSVPAEFVNVMWSIGPHTCASGALAMHLLRHNVVKIELALPVQALRRYEATKRKWLVTRNTGNRFLYSNVNYQWESVEDGLGGRDPTTGIEIQHCAESITARKRRQAGNIEQEHEYGSDSDSEQ